MYSIINQIRYTGYQCWIQLYSPVFWFISVFINHWKLKNKKRRASTTSVSTMKSVSFSNTTTINIVSEHDYYYFDPHWDTNSTTSRLIAPKKNKLTFKAHLQKLKKKPQKLLPAPSLLKLLFKRSKSLFKRKSSL